MKKSLFLSLLSFTLLNAASDIVPQDQAYYVKKVRNTELIFTEQNSKFAQHTAEVEMALQPLYEELFGYQMDEELHVGLTSSYNQIANGFSTQHPNNRQINYMGGALDIDYFSSTSWINTLLYHETTHNYQTNVKDNRVSSTLHSVFGNGVFLAPFMIIPNERESSFLLEGNAVLNESIHGNGGRLYSGRFKAATLMQAKAGYLTPSRVYNNNLFFLYGSHFYTLGGFYQKYLGETYGVEKVDKYWKMHSHHWLWPFMTNDSMQDTIGVDFEDSFNTWASLMKKEAKHIVEPKGKIIARSQFFSPLNADKDEVYFIVNESGRETPDLVVLNKKTAHVKTDIDSWVAGKVIKYKGEYTTQASAKTSPWRTYEGLYDDGAFIVEETKGKMVQGELENGYLVYFDVAESYDQAQLYVGNTFYDQVNSSVFIDKNDMYYFKQKGKTRTLYKNKVPVFSLEGYYSIVSGVDSEGAIYFVGNTKYGSGLFKYKNGNFTRVSSADTIIEARLIDDKTALVASMGSDEFTYQRIGLESIDEAPYVEKLFVENEKFYRQADVNVNPTKAPKVDLEEGYYSMLAMNYSGTTFMLGQDDTAGTTFDLNVNFGDPLSQNSLSLFASRGTDEYILGGATYTNSQYFLQYSLSGYGVIQKSPDINSSANNDDRDYGVAANVSIPLLQVGRYKSGLKGSFFQDYSSDSRAPLSLSWYMDRSEFYGVSAAASSVINFTPYATLDRDDKAYGANATFSQGLGWETYLTVAGQYSSSDVEEDTNSSRGIKITRSTLDKFSDNDPSTVVMNGLIDTDYYKSAAKATAGLKTVINLSTYFFTFPVSLRREILSVDYNYYDFESFVANDDKVTANEVVVGLTLDTYILNVLPIPLTFEYIYNDNKEIAEESSFRFTTGFHF